ncbi:MAG TPA: hypothetical protein PLS03_09355 [Terrimicrobiaceae bacterium]|nr:hypothetical protein [Terrimicrobiaceae bacterium]
MKNEKNSLLSDSSGVISGVKGSRLLGAGFFVTMRKSVKKSARKSAGEQSIQQEGAEIVKRAFELPSVIWEDFERIGKMVGIDGDIVAVIVCAYVFNKEVVAVMNRKTVAA